MGISGKVFYTYIVQCADGTYYIGKTLDLEYRLKQHNGLLKGGARYTRARKPVKLVYYEEYASNKLASQREVCLKKFTRQQKVDLIKG